MGIKVRIRCRMAAKLAFDFIYPLPNITMKKVLFLALAAASFTFASCGGDATTANEGGTGADDASATEAPATEGATDSTMTDAGATTAGSTTTTEGATTEGATTAGTTEGATTAGTTGTTAQ